MNLQRIVLRRVEGQLGHLGGEITGHLDLQTIPALGSPGTGQTLRTLLQSDQVLMQQLAHGTAGIDAAAEDDVVRVERGHEVAEGRVARGLGPDTAGLAAEQLADAQGQRGRHVRRDLGLLAEARLAVVVPRGAGNRGCKVSKRFQTSMGLDTDLTREYR